jgi:hypothetical protein
MSRRQPELCIRNLSTSKSFTLLSVVLFLTLRIQLSQCPSDDDPIFDLLNLRNPAGFHVQLPYSARSLLLDFCFEHGHFILTISRGAVNVICEPGSLKLPSSDPPPRKVPGGSWSRGGPI